MNHVLITGGAGFIGSHTADLLLKKNYRVRVLDNLEWPTHRSGKPDYLDSRIEFMLGDMRNRGNVSRALRGVTHVIHLAATGGFTSDMTKYIEVNSLGTTNILEILASSRHRVQRLLVASSVGIYGEGAYRCMEHGRQTPLMRHLDDLVANRWEVPCPECGIDMTPMPVDELVPAVPEKPYSISKYSQERLVFNFGKSHGVSTVSARYFLTYGPRQSLTNPYTGVVSIFSSLLLNDKAPIFFEDGLQTRDFSHVSDVARANMFLLEHPDAEGVYNVGSGVPSTINEVASILANLYGKSLDPVLDDEFRPGEARHVVADISRLKALGFEPAMTLKKGLKSYVEWIKTQGKVDDYFSAEIEHLKKTGVVYQEGVSTPEKASMEGLTVVVPAYNEVGNLKSIVTYLVDEMSSLLENFEIVIVNDGSRDGTGQLADQLAASNYRIRVVHHPFNIGYGGAQKSGFKNAQMSWVVVVPADHQFDARDLGLFLKERENTDIVASCRVGRRHPMDRRLASWIYNHFMRLVYKVQLRDINWVKMFRKEIFDKIEIESKGFVVDGELVVKAKNLGFRMVEIDVDEYPRNSGKPTRVNMRTIWRTAMELLRIHKMIKRIKKDGN